MYQYDTKVRIRYSETDQMGYVYYGNYAAFYEIGRVEALRDLGTTYKSLEDIGIMMPVLEVNAKYYKPALYDDLITIRTIIKELPRARIIFEHQLFNEKDTLLHEAKTTLTFIKKENHRPCRPPQSIFDALERFFQTEK